MAILGSLIKSFVDVSAILPLDRTDPIACQRDQLRELLKEASDTSFGLYYGFREMVNEDDPTQLFSNRVPIFEYHQMHERWWRQQQKHPSISWPGSPDFFALSSGTTGKSSKRIPVTQDMLKSMRSVGISLLRDLANFDLPPALFEKEVLILSSSANLDENDRGFLEGEISGINVNNFPGWYDVFYRPGKEIAQMDQWDDRLQRIVEEAPLWDIGTLIGIPAWVQLLLQAIKDRYDLKNILELWPDLSVYSTGGVAFEPYRKNFDELIGRPLTIIDTYLASEGFFGYTARPETMSMKLAIDHGIYFEFIPFDDRGFDDHGNLLDSPTVLSMRSVKEDQDYALLISTPAGVWRYMIGDTIKFTDLENLEFVITGRTKFFLNVVGSQLSEEKINAAVGALATDANLGIDEFCVAAMQDENGNHYHQWVLAHEGKLVEEDAVTRLDRYLQEANKNYRVARGKALQYIQVRSISKKVFYDWMESTKKKGGQMKTPKVMSSEKMNDLLGFVDS